MDKLLGLLTDYLHTAQETIVKFSPEVWQATLTLIRIDHIFDLALRLFFTIVFCISLYWCKVWVKSAFVKYNKSHYDDGSEVVGSLAVTTLVSVLLFTIWATSFRDFLGVFSPKLYILYALAQKAGVL